MRNKILIVAQVLLPMLAFAIGGTLGSLYVAYQLGFHEALGPGLFRLFGYTFYAPWKIFQWGFSPFPGVEAFIDQGQNIALYTGLAGVVPSVALKYLRAPGTAAKNATILGDAEFANEAHMKPIGLLDNKGIFIGRLADGRYLRHNGPQHIMVTAPTRSGKGVSVIVPTLLTWTGSAVVYDLKQENYNLTAGIRQAAGLRPIYFNPASLDSAHFNPFDTVRPGPSAISDMQSLAHQIIDPDGKGLNDHWAKTGHALIVGTGLYVLYFGKPHEKNLPGILHKLNDPNFDLPSTLRTMLNSSEPGLPEATRRIMDDLNIVSLSDKFELKPYQAIRSCARAMLNKADAERSGVHSTATSFLELYTDPIVAENVKDSHFSLDDLIQGKTPATLYLVVPPSEEQRLRPLIRLLINLICRRVTEKLLQPHERHEILFLLDEFPALGRLDSFSRALGWMAGYGARALIITQSMNQVEESYGATNSLQDNCDIRIFFAPNTLKTAEYISKCIGDHTVRYNTEGESGKRVSFFLSGKSRSEHYIGRPLMTPAQVRSMPKDEQIILISGVPPIRCKKAIYFEDRQFDRLLLPAPDPKTLQRTTLPSPWREGFKGPGEVIERILLAPPTHETAEAESSSPPSPAPAPAKSNRNKPDSAQLDLFMATQGVVAREDPFSDDGAISVPDKSQTRSITVEIENAPADVAGEKPATF